MMQGGNNNKYNFYADYFLNKKGNTGCSFNQNSSNDAFKNKEQSMVSSNNVFKNKEQSIFSSNNIFKNKEHSMVFSNNIFKNKEQCINPTYTLGNVSFDTTVIVKILDELNKHNTSLLSLQNIISQNISDLQDSINTINNDIENIQNRLTVEESDEDDEIYFGNEEPNQNKIWISDAPIESAQATLLFSPTPQQEIPTETGGIIRAVQYETNIINSAVQYDSNTSASNNESIIVSGAVRYTNNTIR